MVCSNHSSSRGPGLDSAAFFCRGNPVGWAGERRCAKDARTRFPLRLGHPLAPLPPGPPWAGFPLLAPLAVALPVAAGSAPAKAVSGTTAAASKGVSPGAATPAVLGMWALVRGCASISALAGASLVYWAAWVYPTAPASAPWAGWGRWPGACVVLRCNRLHKLHTHHHSGTNDRDCCHIAPSVIR